MGLVAPPSGCDNQGTGGGGGGGSNVTSLNYAISTETLTLSTDQPAVFNTLFPIKFNRAIHVAMNGNDVNAAASTVAPYSLQVPFATIVAAQAASSPLDTIVVWPGVYITPGPIPIDGTKATRFHFLKGAAVLSNPANTLFEISPGITFHISGNGFFGLGNRLFRTIAPTEDISTVYIEGDECIALGANNFWATGDSVRGSIRFNKVTNMYLQVIGWCQLDVAIDNISTTQPVFSIGDINANGGATWTTQYGKSYFNCTGRSSSHVEITASSAGSPNTVVSVGGIAGTAEDRFCNIYANIRTFNTVGFAISEGTTTWDGNGYHEREPLIDPLPFFAFNIDNVGCAFEHSRGNVVTPVDATRGDNTIILITNNCESKFNGAYRNDGATQPLVVLYDSPTGTQRTFLNGDFNMGPDGGVGIFQLNNQGFGNVFDIYFGTATAISQRGTPMLETITGVPQNFFVMHSLISNTTYDTSTFTDISTGNRLYVDANINNFTVRQT